MNWAWPTGGGNADNEKHTVERRNPDQNPHLGRRENIPGRRQMDYDLRITFSKKLLVVLVIVAQIVVHLSEILTGWHTSCP